MRRGRELNRITFCFVPLIDATLILATPLAHGKTIKALRHLLWAVMFVCPRWLVWRIDLSPCSGAAEAQWGNTLAVLATGNGGAGQLLPSGICFAFGTCFYRWHLPFEAWWGDGSCSCREVGADLKCRTRCSRVSPAGSADLCRELLVPRRVPSERVPIFSCYAIGLESRICSAIDVRFYCSAGILL